MMSDLSNRLVSIVSLIFLARILSPEDFGLVAIAMIFVGFADAVSTTGSYRYVLSRETITKEVVYTAWSINFVVILSISLLLAYSSVLIADFYDDSRLISIIIAVSVLLVMRRLVSPGLIYKERSQDLGKLSVAKMAVKIISSIVTLSVAMLSKSYWALIVGHLVSAVLFSFASFYIAPMKLRLSFVNFKPQWDFSKWITPNAVINYFRSQMDTLLVSGLFGKDILGAYNSMKYYTSIPNSVFIGTIISPLLPQLAELKKHKEYFIKQVQVLVYVLAAICTPVIYLMFVHSKYIVTLILGEQWSSYSDMFAIFSFSIIKLTVAGVNGHFVMLHNKTKLALGFTVISIILQIVLFSAFDFSDVYKLATAVTILDTLLWVALFSYILNISLGRKYILLIFQPIILPLVVFCFAWSFSEIFVGFTNEHLFFVVHSFVFSVIYLSVGLATCYMLKSKLYYCDYVLAILVKGVSKLLKRNKAL